MQINMSILTLVLDLHEAFKCDILFLHRNGRKAWKPGLNWFIFFF
jgi:hypothetical protein